LGRRRGGEKWLNFPGPIPAWGEWAKRKISFDKCNKREKGVGGGGKVGGMGAENRAG